MNSASESPRCVACQKLESALPNPLKRCAQCKSTFYCSRQCQKDDWKAHKTHCNQANDAKPSTTSNSPDSAQRLENLFKLFAQSGLTGDTNDIFTAPNKPGYLCRLPEREVYAAIIDSYRLRIEDEYVFTGEASGLYAHEDPLPDFRRYLAKVEKCGNILPAWWNRTKRHMCERQATSASERSDINCTVKKSDIMEHYKDRLMPMRLRMIAEMATGKHLGL